MKYSKYILYLLTLFTMSSTKIPQTKISNGLINATIYLPEKSKGYYQGTRFDRSGIIASLEFKGHNYFGQWFSKYSPEIHDVIMGPVEEFTPLDYPEITSGDTFVKIGVGTVYKQDDRPYEFDRVYQLMNEGKWTVKEYPEKVLFTHELKDKSYSYHYEKSVQLTPDKPELVLHHTLKNTGNKTIETSVYDHNFFMIDKHPIGPGLVLKVPFNLKGEGIGFGEIAEIQGNQIAFKRPLGNGEHAECYDLQGFGPGVEDYDIRLENRITGAGVRITCDQPLLKLAFWTITTVMCPEPYIKIKVEPGKEISWTIKYEFYTLNR